MPLPLASCCRTVQPRCRKCLCRHTHSCAFCGFIVTVFLKQAYMVLWCHLWLQRKRIFPPSLQVPFLELHGESTEYVGRADDAVIALSNYRLHIKFKESVVNVSCLFRTGNLLAMEAGAAPVGLPFKTENV